MINEPDRWENISSDGEWLLKGMKYILLLAIDGFTRGTGALLELDISIQAGIHL